MKPRFFTQLLLLVLVCIGFSLATDVYPQSATEEGESKKPVAIKVSEVINDGFEMYSSCLDDFASKLQNMPNATGVIITYGPEGTRSGTADFLLRQLKDYMSGARGLEEDRITAINGGPSIAAAETKTELWLVPPGAKRPKPQKHDVGLKSFVGLVGDHYGAEGPGETDWEGPSPGEVAMAAFAQILQHQPDSVGYLVTHPLDVSFGGWRRIGQYDIELLEGYGIKAERLKIIHGTPVGTGDFPLDEFWVQRKNDPPPVKDVGPDRLGQEAVQIGQFNEFDLGELKDQDRAFKTTADLFKEFPDAKLCFMIMPPSVEEDKSENKDVKDPKETPKEDELPKADFHEVVEKWRAKLISDFKINPNRIVILYPTGVDESFFGLMQSWIVPKNAVLPSPPKVDDDPPDDDPPIYQR